MLQPISPRTRVYTYVYDRSARAHPGKPCDLFSQLAKKLVNRAAALLARTPGIRRLPLGSTHGQCGIPEVAFSSFSSRHWRVYICQSPAQFSLELVPSYEDH